MGWIGIPPPPRFLSTQNFRMWLYLAVGSLQIQLVKIKSTELGLVLNPLTGVLIRRGRNGDTQRHRANKGNEPCEDQGKTGVQLPKAKDCQEPPEARTRQGRILPRAFRGSLALPILWFRISRLQNCKRTHCCGFKLPSLWYYVTAALANNNYRSSFRAPLNSAPQRNAALASPGPDWEASLCGRGGAEREEFTGLYRINLL